MRAILQLELLIFTKLLKIRETRKLNDVEHKLREFNKQTYWTHAFILISFWNKNLYEIVARKTERIPG